MPALGQRGHDMGGGVAGYIDYNVSKLGLPLTLVITCSVRLALLMGRGPPLTFSAQKMPRTKKDSKESHVKQAESLGK